jgi:hypothetical protein
MEHWFDRATKMFAGSAISRRGLLEGGALAGTAVLVAQTPGLARGSSSAPCSLTGDGSSTTLSFSARSSYKGQALTLQGTHVGRGRKYRSGRTHIVVALAGKTVLEIAHSATQTGTSKGRVSPTLQGTVTYGAGYSGVHRVTSLTREGSVSGFVDGRAFTATSGSSTGRMRDGKAAPAPHVDPALAQAVRALFQTASSNAGQCHGASHHAAVPGPNVAATRGQLFAPLRELARRTADDRGARELAQTFPSGPCADCYNACDAKAVECETKAGASCASGPFCLVPIALCINSWKNCNSDCYKPGGPCCAVKCHPVNSSESSCCGSGTTCCGDTCCGGSTPVCSHPTSEPIYGFCCPSGTYGCNTVAQSGGVWYDTCCAKGSQCCGTLCCSSSQYCASSVGLLCCSKGQSYCGGQCCSGKCMKDGAGNEFCCSGSALCGSTCCGPNEKCLTGPGGSKVCCNGALCGGKCCGPGAICHNGTCAYGKPCGKTSCGLTNPVCCNGVCCASNQTCVSGKCTTARCKRKGTVPCQYTPGLCCKPGATCCGKTCCKPGMPCCGGICTTNQCIQ